AKSPRPDTRRSEWPPAGDDGPAARPASGLLSDGHYRSRRAARRRARAVLASSRCRAASRGTPGPASRRTGPSNHRRVHHEKLSIEVDKHIEGRVALLSHGIWLSY